MSVVNLVILLVNVACVLVHEDWVVEGAEVHLLDAAEVPVMMVMDAGILKTYVFLFFPLHCASCGKIVLFAASFLSFVSQFT